MVYIPVTHYYGVDPIAKLAMHFKEKKAVSADSAIAMDHIDWISILGYAASDNSNRMLKNYPFIKMSGNKYWFDTEAYFEYKKSLPGKFLRLFLIIMLVSAVFIGLLSWAIVATQ